MLIQGTAGQILGIGVSTVQWLYNYTTAAVDITTEDTTAKLSKQCGQYGGTYDSHINMDTTAKPCTVPNNRPNITLCTPIVQNLISITFIRMNILYLFYCYINVQLLVTLLTKWMGVKGACAPTNHPFKALEFVLINNWDLKLWLYFGLYDKALLVSYNIKSFSKFYIMYFWINLR